MLKKFLKPQVLPLRADLAILILRIGSSLLMMRYGYDKLLQYLSGDHSFADPIGIGEEFSLILAVGAEFFCSILVLVGLGTRLALIPLIITMLVAFFIIHADDPFDKKEHPLVFLIPYVAVMLTGAGRFSLDRKIFY